MRPPRVMPNLKVLVLDDDPGVGKYLTQMLHMQGWDGRFVSTTAEARPLLADTDFDVILLDISMPEESGWDFLQSIRGTGVETPVIFLTAHQETDDRVRGLRLGADDYVVKPFEPEELIARIEAVYRRRQTLPAFSVGPLRIDLVRRIVELSGERVEISPRELDVLAELVQAKGQILSKAELLRRVWGVEKDPGTKVLEVQVARLRRKLSVPEGQLIETVIGEGYRIVDPAV